MYENVEVRQVLCSTLDKLMSENDRIVVIDADLAKANGTLSLRGKYPERAFDMGVAEQNMAGVAAGMAAYGFIPFIGSFTAFAARRICDQIAISITYAKRNVKIIGSDPGVSAELNGGTHMSMEDIGVLRSIPGMVIFEAADAVELEKALPQIVSYDGVVYIRLFRKAAPVIYDKDYKFDLFKADVIKEGKDVTLIASGIMVSEALKAREMLKQEGILAEVINVHTIKPLDSETILNSVKKTNAVVTCENHNIIGGLKSAVSELLIEEYPVYLTSVGVKDHFGEVASMDYLMKKYKMTAQDIVLKAKECIKKKGR